LGRRKQGSIWCNERGEVCIKTENGKKSYHRFIVEKYLGYHLSQSLTIHHINGDHKCNELSNLMIVTAELHSILHQYDFAHTDKFVSNLHLYRKDKSKEYKNDNF